MIPIPLFLAIFALWALCLIGCVVVAWNSGKRHGRYDLLREQDEKEKRYLDRF